MATGNWSFLQEWTIYEYINKRFAEGTLRFKCILKQGRIQKSARSFIKVNDLVEVKATDFPDIKRIKLAKEKVFRPAEIKFTTSLFNYHTDSHYLSQFNKFIREKGFILVIKHDRLPKGFTKYYKKIDVYEIDTSDFISFCRENFNRLLNRQIKLHSEQKVWIMYQGPKNYEYIRKKKKKIWCPTDNLSSLDLGIDDRIMFIKTGGASQQEVQRYYLKDKICKKWKLMEITFARVSSLIKSRQQYCQEKNINYKQKLWINDPLGKSGWRFDRVFEFEEIKTYTNEIDMFNYELNNKNVRPMVDAMTEAYLYNKSREIQPNEYMQLLESLL